MPASSLRQNRSQKGRPYQPHPPSQQCNTVKSLFDLKKYVQKTKTSQPCKKMFQNSISSAPTAK